jgi:hypothetical protein
MLMVFLHIFNLRNLQIQFYSYAYVDGGLRYIQFQQTSDTTIVAILPQFYEIAGTKFLFLYLFLY